MMYIYIKYYFEIETNPPILSKRSDLILICKKKITCHLVDFVVPADYKVKAKDRQILRSCQRAKKKKKKSCGI